MFFCSQCGSQLKENSKFCKKCGTPVEDYDVSAATQKFDIDIDIEADYGIPEIDVSDGADFPIKKSGIFDTQTQEIVNYVNSMSDIPNDLSGNRGIEVGSAAPRHTGVHSGVHPGLPADKPGVISSGRQGHAFSPGKPMSAYNPQDTGVSDPNYGNVFGSGNTQASRAERAKLASVQRQGGYTPPPRPNEYSIRNNQQNESFFQSKKVLLISIAVAVVVLAVGILAILSAVGGTGGELEAPRPDDDGIIAIPRFIGQLLEDIESNAEMAEMFNFNILYEFSREPVGTVLDQLPSADLQVSVPDAGRRLNVRLTVSQGEQPTMPDLVGLHYIEAQNLLRSLDDDYSLNLEIRIQERVTDENPDHIIDTIPHQGTQLGRGATVLIVVGVEQETPMVTIPDLVGHTRAALESIFAADGLVPLFSPIEDEAAVDTVIHIVGVGLEVPEGTEVEVHISIGPPEPPTVVIPNLVGSARSALESAFASLGIVPDISLHESDFPQGTVIYISRVGQDVPIDTEIEVHVSLGPPAPLEVTTVAITSLGAVVLDFTGLVGTRTPLAVNIGPAGAEQGAEITWVSSNPTVVEITPDPGGLTAAAMHMSPGWATITVTVNDVSTGVIARTQG